MTTISKFKWVFAIVFFTLMHNGGPVKAQGFPFGFNYQAVARDASGNAKTNTNVGVRISILKGAATGPLTYQETFSTVTNSMGQFVLTIGSGIFITGTIPTFSAIPWHEDIYYMRTEIQTGATTFAVIDTKPLMAVPYALNARSVPPTVKHFTLAGPGTYTPSPGVLYIEVEMIGGGGGGGSGNTSFHGGGGGAGGAMKFMVTPLAPSYGYTVGAGGAANAPGGSTSFSTNVCTGGNGGTWSNTSSTPGGTGTITFGTGIVFAGGRGGAGGSGFTLQGAHGGNGIFGGGGGAGSSTNGGVGGAGGAGAPNTGGGGGGGGGGTAGASTGSAGGSGVIIVKEFYK